MGPGGLDRFQARNGFAQERELTTQVNSTLVASQE